MALIALIISVSLLMGCIGDDDDNGGSSGPKEIVVIGRDSNSGTRASFEELTMEDLEVVQTMLQKNSNGAVHDSVADTPGAIGYVGLGYLDSEVKAVKIDGVTPSIDTVLDGTYPIARSLHFITDGTPTGLAADFLKFVLSDAGQTIVADEGFVSLPPGGDAVGMTGDLTITGSTTVLPVAQAAASKYNELYGANILVSGGGSSVGVTAAADGTADLGMASRDLKSSEKDKYPSLQEHVVAKDGIAVIIHPDNSVNDLTVEQVRDIYSGKITEWGEI
jgi:phosphate transport system substrate-binding protein